MLLTLCCFGVCSTRRFVLFHALCYLFLGIFNPFIIAITSLREENLSAFRTRVLFCLFPLPLGVGEVLRLVIVTLSKLFSYFLFSINRSVKSILPFSYP